MPDDPNAPHQPDMWATLLKAAIAALAPVVIKAVLDAFGLLERKLAPWDGADRRTPPPAPQEASQTP